MFFEEGALKMVVNSCNFHLVHKEGRGVRGRGIHMLDTYPFAGFCAPAEKLMHSFFT
jgi:hypothetical protein